MEYSRGLDYICSHLVMHIFIRTRTFFSHLIGAFILRTAPETVVVFLAQVVQNAVQAFHRLCQRSSATSASEKKNGGGEGGTEVE